ncbi:MAG: methylenetetrahydrofolate dehydrogenase / methenyltetrahydrofolate cyclohydrolase [Patescibacteria group bacterium]|jgi:methylenetetrahydrofolate dehydrogenase (NADP+)/methenyltetrahydrofolate cyclohydrolase|nr:methylenetetrahydrofolate dehydrogenase / methenyltetrahydrofolate cyclohydrolase [Patescibacteria group bacterium]
MVQILDGKKLSEKIADRLKREISKFPKAPTLAIIQVGEKRESSSYIDRKKKFAEKIGAKVHHIILEEKITTEKLAEAVEVLNSDKNIHGIIVQLPLPKKIDRFKVIETISPLKDVDGLTSANAGLLYESAFGGNDPKNVSARMIPATAKGIISLLKESKIPLAGKKALVVGRSLLVGKPVALLLLKENATVTIAHSKTVDLPKLSKENDVVVVAVGKPKFFNKSFVKKGQVIVDVGTNSLTGPKLLEEVSKTKLVGDVDFDQVSKVVSAISPVPGGVGPMTVASLFENLVVAFKSQK